MEVLQDQEQNKAYALLEYLKRLYSQIHKYKEKL